MVDTPISELGFTGAALGASATGVRCVADLMFADFLFEAAGQIVLQAAKLRYMSNGRMQAPMVIRVGAGAVRSAGPHHSGTYHPVWAHIPGLVVCLPSTPADAKGLMKTALRARDPVIMLETKALFASTGPVPEGEHLVPFGVARIARAGTDLTIASAGQLVAEALEAAEILAEEGVSVEVIDLRTIQPLDVETVADSVRRTHRLLVVDEAYAHVRRRRRARAGHERALLRRASTARWPGCIRRPSRIPSRPPWRGRCSSRRRRSSSGRGASWRASPIRSSEWASASGHGPSGPPRRLRSLTAPAPHPPHPRLPRRPNAPSTRRRRTDHDAVRRSDGERRALVKWHRKLGDRVAAGDHVADIETDKAVVEIESPRSGVLAEILAEEGAVVPMGASIGVVREGG